MLAQVSIDNSSLGLAQMITLQPEKTWVWLNGFYPYVSEIDSITMPSGSPSAQNHLKYQWDRSHGNCDSMQLWWEGDDYGKSTALQYFKIWSKGKSLTVPVRKSEKQLREFRWTTSKGKYESVKVKGTFNAWNPNNLVLRWEEDATKSGEGAWVGKTWVGPGSHQYVFVVDYAKVQKEIRDPNNSDSVGNGMGGFNSTFLVESCNLQIETAYTSPLPSDFWNSNLPTEIYVSTRFSAGIGKGDYNSVLAMWQNQKLEVGLGEHDSQLDLDILKIVVPKEAFSGGRLASELSNTFIRVWIGSSEGVSNEVLVPLVGGRVMFDPVKFMDRKDPHRMIMYNPMIDRFVDGNKENNRPLNRPDVDPKVDFYGGDVVGISKKIEEGYFNNLGINTIWISPVVKNPEGPYGQWTKTPKTKFSGYHGYWPVSLRATDPRFCTESELKQMIDIAHKHHINVFLDYVAHHVHQEHPLVKQKPDWFTPLYLPDGSKNTERWDDYRLTTWFDDFMPTFNYFKPEVVDAMTDSALWWFKNFDIDGFRHDATKHIPDPFWRSLTYKLKTEVALPNHRPYYQIGETYGSPELISSYLGSGTLDAQFDFNMYDAAVMAFKGHGSCKNLAQTLNDSKKWYGAHHTMGNVSGNQDKPRIISLLDGSIKDGEDTKQAGWDRDIQVKNLESQSTTTGGQNSGDAYLSGRSAYLSVLNMMAFNMSIPGIPVIYYGDEIGMPGANDPDCRRMMRFDQGIQSNSGVAVAVTDMSVDELLAAKTGWNSGSVVAKTPGAKAMAGKTQLGLSEQERELRTWISQLINFRNTHLALTYGDMEVSALGDDLLIIKRKYFGEIVYAVFNRSTESKTVELSFSDVANFTKTKSGKSYLGIVGAVHTFNDSPLITDDVNTYTVVIPAGGFEYIYN